MALIFLFWWFGILHFQSWVPLPGSVSLHLASIFAMLFWPIAAYAVIEFLVSLLAVVARSRVKTHAVASIARYAVGIIIFTLLLRAGHWIIVTGDLPTPRALGSMETGFNTGMRLGILGALATVLVLLTLDARRLWLVLQAEKAELLS